MRSTMTHPSSPRRRGPIRRALSMWHPSRRLLTVVVMGPRLRGDDTEFAAPFRPLFAALIACAVLMPGSQPASAADKIRVGKAVAEAFSFVPPDVGMREGIFQKNNVDVELTTFAGDARMQQAAAGDSIDALLGAG